MARVHLPVAPACNVFVQFLRPGASIATTDWQEWKESSPSVKQRRCFYAPRASNKPGVNISMVA